MKELKEFCFQTTAWHIRKHPIKVCKKQILTPFVISNAENFLTIKKVAELRNDNDQTSP